MQAFLCSTDPVVAARSLDDRRINKLITETHQLLHLASGEGRFGWANVNHRLCCWSRTRFGYSWVVQYHTALFNEYRRRLGRIEHRSFQAWPVYDDGAAWRRIKRYGVGEFRDPENVAWCNATGFILGGSYAVKPELVGVLVRYYRTRLRLKWEAEDIIRIAGLKISHTAWTQKLEETLWRDSR